MTRSDTAVGIVGLGYVGLPLALTMTDAGYTVIGVDTDAEKIAQLSNGQSYITDVTDGEVQEGLDAGFTPTTEYGDLSSVAGVSVCVPTPLRKTDQPDLSFVVRAVEDLAEVIPRQCTVVLESTVYPGATEEIVAETLTVNGRTVGEDIFLAFSPERIDPGNESYGPASIPKVIGGVTVACGDHAEGLYEPVFDEIIRVDSATEAELVKLLENTFRAVNIGLINELAQVANALEVNIWNVIDAAKTKPFGFMPFYPGPGLGGHCIPIDPFYLSWKANQQGVETRFIELADQVNREMPVHVVRRVTDALNDAGIPLPNARVIVIGAAYKPNVSDIRESPALDIISMLDKRGASVSYHDPYVPAIEIGDARYASTDLTTECLRDHDCAVIVTDHAQLDFDRVVAHAPLVFDTRNATRGVDNEHVIRL